MKGKICLLALLVLFLQAEIWNTPIFAWDFRSFGLRKTKKKVPPPPRFKDNGDGTLTDRITGLVWLKDANCVVFFKEDTASKSNSRTWREAQISADQLADGFCGLSDTSQAGDWRLPDRKELFSIARHQPKIEKWAAAKAFTGIQFFYYWSSSTGDLYPDYAFYVSIAYGVDSYAFQLNNFHVLPVRVRNK